MKIILEGREGILALVGTKAITPYLGYPSPALLTTASQCLLLHCWGNSSTFIAHMLSTPQQIRYEANSRCLSLALAGVCESAVFKSMGELVYFLEPIRLPSHKVLHCVPWASYLSSLYVSQCLVPSYLSHLPCSSSLLQARSSIACRKWGWSILCFFVECMHAPESPLRGFPPPPLGASTLLSWGCILGRQKALRVWSLRVLLRSLDSASSSSPWISDWFFQGAVIADIWGWRLSLLSHVKGMLPKQLLPQNGAGNSRH